MKTFLMMCLAAFAAATIAPAQEREHAGIHQVESELHHWDVVKLDKRVPEFSRGKTLAAAGKQKQALAEFQKGARKNKASGLFNIGLVYFYSGNYSAALHNFQQSERVRRDSLAHSFAENAKRLITEHSKKKTR